MDQEPPLESTDVVRIVCRHSHAGVLRLRESKPMVHSGIRRRVSAGFGLWISPRRLALRSGRGNLVAGSGPAMVAGGKLALTLQHAHTSAEKARFVSGHRFSD